jgi:hypothetical protein
MAKTFLSYSYKDKSFVRELAEDLTRLGHTVWLDEWEIRVGDSIITKIGRGIEDANYVLVVLSQNSTSSEWVEKEWQAKYWDEINRRKVMVLPVVLEDCSIPTLLRPKKYADFRVNYKVGLAELILALYPRRDTSGILRYYADFVDIVDDWQVLFQKSSTLDIVINYGATWRNTFLKEIIKLLKKPNSRLRVVLPEVSTRTSLLSLHAEHQDVSSSEFRGRVQTAIRDFRALSEYGRVEIYTSHRYFTHAIYLSDSGGILALYCLSGGRVPTPAFFLEDGEMLRFVRDDFGWLISEDNPSRRIVFPKIVR